MCSITTLAPVGVLTAASKPQHITHDAVPAAPLGVLNHRAGIARHPRLQRPRPVAVIVLVPQPRDARSAPQPAAADLAAAAAAIRAFLDAYNHGAAALTGHELARVVPGLDEQRVGTLQLGEHLHHQLQGVAAVWMCLKYVITRQQEGR